VRINFIADGNITTVKETFEAEPIHPIQLQQEGWQAILDNFKKYAEAPGKSDALHFKISINAGAEIVYKTMLGEKHMQRGQLSLILPHILKARGKREAKSCSWERIKMVLLEEW